MTSEWWDDDDDDPLLDHVLRVLYPVQSMFERVRESLRDTGYVQFDHLFTLNKECIQDLTYPNPDGHGRLPLSPSIRSHLLNVMHYNRYFVNCHGRVMTDEDWGAFSASALEAFRFSSATKADVDWEDLLVCEEFIIFDEPDGRMTEQLGIQSAATVATMADEPTASTYGLVHNGADIHPVYMAQQTDYSDDDLPADDICPWNLSYRTTYDARQQTSDLHTGDDSWHTDLQAQTEFFYNEDDLLDDAGPWDPGFAVGAPGDPPDDITVVDPTTIFSVTALAAHNLAVAVTSSGYFSHRNQIRHLLGSNLAPSDAVSGTGGFTIDVVRQVHQRSDRPSVLPPPPPPIPIRPAHYLGDIMHHISDAYDTTGPGSMSIPLAAPPYVALVHCTVPVHCNVTVVYVVVAPPIGEVVDSYDRRINTSNIAVNAYMVTNHSAAVVLLGDDDAHSGVTAYDGHIDTASHDYWCWVNIKGIIDLCHRTNTQSILVGAYTVSSHGVVTIDIHHQWTDMMWRATTTVSLGRQYEVTTSTVGYVYYRHRAGVDGLPYLLSTGTSHALGLTYLLSSSTSHVLGLPYLLDTRRSCPHVVGNAWDQYPHVLTACEVDWGPRIIIDGESCLSRHYGNLLASNGECPISGDDVRVGATEREFIGTTVHHSDNCDAIVTLANLRVVSDYFDHYYTTAQSNNDASMLPVTVHHELRPPAEPPPALMDFVLSQNDDNECKTYNVLNTSFPWYFERAISTEVSTFAWLDHVTRNVTTSSSVKIVYAKVDLTNFLDGARRFKSVIGPFQWAAIMGRINVTTAMMIPSGSSTARLRDKRRCVLLPIQVCDNQVQIP